MAYHTIDEQRHEQRRPYPIASGAPAITMTLLRIAVGVIMVAHGAQKLMNIDGFQSHLAQLGMPMPETFGLLAIAAEFLGGLALILGLLTRVAAFGVFCTMAVAIYLVHLPHGLLASNNGFEYPLTLLCAALFFIATGAGPYSLDAWFGRMLHRRRTGTVSEPVLVDERPAIPARRHVVARDPELDPVDETGREVSDSDRPGRPAFWHRNHERSHR